MGRAVRCRGRKKWGAACSNWGNNAIIISQHADLQIAHDSRNLRCRGNSRTTLHHHHAGSSFTKRSTIHSKKKLVHAYKQLKIGNLLLEKTT